MLLPCELIEKTLKDNFICIKTIKDESSLLHAILFAFAQEYRNCLQEERINLVKKIRRRLAAHMPDFVKLEELVEKQQKMIGNYTLDKDFMDILVQLLKVNIKLYSDTKWYNYENENNTLTVIINQEHNYYNTVGYKDNNTIITCFMPNDDKLLSL